MVTTSVVTVPKILGRKTSGLIVTNQVAATIVVTVPHILAAKQAGLLLHKSGGHNNRGYWSPYS